MNKSQTTREQAIEVGLSFREAEWRLDTQLFLNEYPRWELGAPHHPVVLHKMFQYAAEQGWKEVEWMICQGCQHSLPRLDPKVYVSAVQLVGP